MVPWAMPSRHRYCKGSPGGKLVTQWTRKTQLLGFAKYRCLPPQAVSTLSNVRADFWPFRATRFRVSRTPAERQPGPVLSEDGGGYGTRTHKPEGAGFQDRCVTSYANPPQRDRNSIVPDGTDGAKSVRIEKTVPTKIDWQGRLS